MLLQRDRASFDEEKVEVEKVKEEEEEEEVEEEGRRLARCRRRLRR